MKTNTNKIGAAVWALGICAFCMVANAQETTTTVTTTKGAFTEFVPASKTVIVRSETNPAPLRYSVTEKTTIMNEAGAPVTLDQVPAGTPLSVYYTGAGDRLVASRIVVERPVTTERTTTTTTTTRPLTHEEKEAQEEAQEDRKERAEEQIERREEAVEKASDQEKERLEKLKDDLDDDH
jgi:hypothetical protein